MQRPAISALYILSLCQLDASTHPSGRRGCSERCGGRTTAGTTGRRSPLNVRSIDAGLIPLTDSIADGIADTWSWNAKTKAAKPTAVPSKPRFVIDLKRISRPAPPSWYRWWRWRGKRFRAGAIFFSEDTAQGRISWSAPHGPRSPEFAVFDDFNRLIDGGQ